MIVFIDSGVLGLLSSPSNNPVVTACQEWLYSLLARGVYVISSEICDYEVRRGLILTSLTKTTKASGLDILDGLATNLIDFLPITKTALRQAAQLWAESRSQGMPTADTINIDADVIIAAQCQLMQEQQPGQYLVVATTNVKHLSRFVNAQKWQDISF